MLSSWPGAATAVLSSQQSALGLLPKPGVSREPSQAQQLPEEREDAGGLLAPSSSFRRGSLARLVLSGQPRLQDQRG